MLAVYMRHLLLLAGFYKKREPKLIICLSNKYNIFELKLASRNCLITLDKSIIHSIKKYFLHLKIYEC